MIEWVEVSPRDGLQNEAVHLPTADKIALIRRAADAGAKRIEVASFVNPAKVPQMADAEAVQAAGAFAVVLEKVPVGLSARITQGLAIPTIGIGAGAQCDGQVLVVDDMLGMFTEFRPKFVKRYAELGTAADQAIAAYAEDVRAHRFPAPEHGFADEAPKVSKS